MPQNSWVISGEADDRDVHVMDDFETPPPIVPQNAEKIELGGRAEWYWKDEQGKYQSVIAQTPDAGREQRNLSLGPPEGPAEPQDRLRGPLGPAARAAGQAEDFVREGVSGLTGAAAEIFNTIGKAGVTVFKPADMLSDWMIEQSGTDNPKVKAMAREAMRIGEVQLLVSGFSATLGGPSGAAASTAVGAARMNAIRKAAAAAFSGRSGMELLIAGGTGGAMGYFFGEQTDTEATHDLAAELGGTAGQALGTRLAAGKAFIEMLPPSARFGGMALLATGHKLLKNKGLQGKALEALQRGAPNAGGLVGRVAGSAAGLVGTGYDLGESFWGDVMHIGVPGFMTGVQARKASGIRKANVPSDSRSVSGAARRTLKRLDDKVAGLEEDLTTRFTGEELEGAIQNARLNWVDPAYDFHLAEMFASKDRQRGLASFTPNTTSRRSSAALEARLRLMFPQEFTSDQMEGLAQHMTEVRRVSKLPLKALKQEGLPREFKQFAQTVMNSPLERLTNFRQFKQLKDPVARAALIRHNMQVVDSIMEDVTKSPQSLNEFATAVKLLEQAKSTRGLARAFKDTYIQKGILGSALGAAPVSNTNVAEEAAGAFTFEGSKILAHLEDKRNEAALRHLFGNDEFGALKDTARLTAFLQEGIQKTEAEKFEGRIGAFLSARAAFVLSTGAFASEPTKGSKFFNMLLGVGAAHVGTDVAISASRMFKMATNQPHLVSSYVDAAIRGDTLTSQVRLRALLRAENPELAKQMGIDQEEEPAEGFMGR